MILTKLSQKCFKNEHKYNIQLNIFFKNNIYKLFGIQIACTYITGVHYEKNRQIIS